MQTDKKYRTFKNSVAVLATEFVFDLKNVTRHAATVSLLSFQQNLPENLSPHRCKLQNGNGGYADK
jgi:hypothetical protein